MENRAEIIDAVEKAVVSNGIQRVYIAGGQTKPPVMAFVVNFARISIVLEGSHEMLIEQGRKAVRIAPGCGEAVFIGPNCWNKPTWGRPTTVATFLFGKRQTGISLVRAGGGGDTDIVAEKYSVAGALDGTAGKILDVAVEVARMRGGMRTFPELVSSVVEATLGFMKGSERQGQTRAYRLYQNVCTWLQENFQYDITRDSTAAEFAVTPNHLSRLFRIEGGMKFSDYLTYVRIDRAKFMLANYDMTLKEVAQRCGYSETGYFCRVFKKVTRKTPSAYRQGLGQRAGTS